MAKTLIGVLFFVSLIIEYYSYQAIKTLTSKKILRRIWIAFSISSFLIIFVWSIYIDRNNRAQVQFLMGFFVLTYLPKLVLSSVLIIEDIYRFVFYIFKKTTKRAENHRENSSYYPDRRKAISTLGLGLASIPFFAVIEGIVWGKFDFRVRKITLSFPDLPDSFDGYKIAQLSDIHMGSFDIKDYNKIEKGIQLLNEQKPDIFFFTGDSVNNYADEIKPWLNLLKTIKSKDGKYSILGNHDYGIYVFGAENKSAQEKNIEKLHQYHSEIGWDLLMNESVKLHKGDDTINLIGVRNWGAGGHFPKDGDLQKATEHINDGEFNILLSHDPSHFDQKIKQFPKKMHLTLSGHTHGMQFGVEIPGIIKWSPVKYQYPKWAGLYRENDRYLYVNRGFGFIGFPGRVGIWPEITLIELKKG
ncbi:metallophosphoesterase [Apibacter sp. HY039]|uniref:metallophosphoesterase n=1 Tax=Apibacter sp. HY039 TaxID=2501476 RepID=UPI000FEBBDD2|nr:metallophosphoesterase [Apibacter sp. HY039]